MSTVATPAQLEEIHNFVMPKTRQGMEVTYFLPGTLDKATAIIAFVLQVAKSQRTIAVFVPGSGPIDGVRHITDPKLKLSAEQRESGAWDYSPEWIETQRRLQELDSRLADLEGIHEAKRAKRSGGE